MYVREVDHRRALRLVGDLAHTTSVAEFVGVLLPGVRTTVGADEVTYSEIAIRTWTVGPTHGYPTTPQRAAAAARVWSTRTTEHPWVRLALRQGRHDAVRLSDLCTHSALQQSAYYRDFYRPRGLEYADYATIAAADGTFIGVGLGRSGRDFSDSEHDVVEHLRRPLGGVWSAVRRTDALRSAALATATPPRAAAAALSPAERRVAGLVSRGCSNREVAMVLGISRKAVEQHLTRVYRLLGVSSRSQLVRLVLTAEQ